MSEFPYKFGSPSQDPQKLDQALQANFRKAATSEYVDTRETAITSAYTSAIAAAVAAQALLTTTEIATAITAERYYAGLYLANSGAPRHSDTGNWQNVADGGGTDTWTALCDVRPSGVSAQLDTDSGDGTITIRKTGIYLLSYSVAFATIADEVLTAAGVSLAGAGTPSYVTTLTASNGTTTSVLDPHKTEMVSLTNGDVLNLMAYQNSGGDEEYLMTFQRCMMSVQYLGPAS